MPRIGIKELKNKATEIMRTVREQRSEYVITYHGKPSAILLPIDEESLETETEQLVKSAAPSADTWAELAEIRREVGQNWQSDKTAVELVSEQRR